MRAARRRPGGLAARAAVLVLPILPFLAAPGAAAVQDDEPRISATWRGDPIHDVLLTLADVAGRSIVVGTGVTGFVTATVTDQPWDSVLEAVLFGHGLVVEESSSGILRVQPMEAVRARESADPLVTRSYRIDYVPAAELQAALAPLLTERGSIIVATTLNTLVVSDVPRVQAAIAALLGKPAEGQGPR